MRRLAGWWVVVALLAAPATGWTQQLDLAVGAKGGLQFGGATEVPEDTPYGDPQLLGLFGTGGGAGPALDLRYNNIVGLETAVYFTNDTYSGTNEIESERSGDVVAELTQTQRTTATHVPVLVKVSPPFEHIRPVLGLGVEFVSQNKADLSYRGENVRQQQLERLEATRTGTPANYTMFQVTAGAEFDVGPVRIPVELRVGYNLGWDDSFDKRVDIDGSGRDATFVYDGAYMGHFGLFTGVLYRWDLAL